MDGHGVLSEVRTSYVKKQDDRPLVIDLFDFGDVYRKECQAFLPRWWTT